MFDPALSGNQPEADKRPGERPRMNVSPLDLRQQRFRKTFRGFDRVEVTSFLVAVADDYEQALRETDRLRQDLSRMEALLTEHREHEKNLKATLTTAQQLADDIKAHAEEEARRIIRDAQGRSELLLEKTQARLEDIQREIDGLKLKRRDVEVSLESTIQTLRNTLEYVRDQEAREREDKILLHRPRHNYELQDGRIAELQEGRQEVKVR
jgi:cell division initiation protein